MAEDRVRRRLAEDLHDDLVQLLCAAKLKLARGSQSADLHAVREILTQTRELVESAERRGRSLCFDLSPPLEHRQDLSAAIDWLCAELRQRYDLRIDIQQPRPWVGLSEATRSVVFRAVRELLINAAKHAPSRAASLHVLRRNGLLVITVRNGAPEHRPANDTTTQSIDAAAPLWAGGFGLVSMARRLRMLGGSLDFHNGPAEAVARVRVPIDLE